MLVELLKFVLSIAKYGILSLGALVLFVLVELMVKFELIILPAWSDNLLDNVFYFAYDYEQFGFLSIVTRWTIAVLVVWKIYDLAAFAYKKIDQN